MHSKYAGETEEVELGCIVCGHREGGYFSNSSNSSGYFSKFERFQWVFLNFPHYLCNYFTSPLARLKPLQQQKSPRTP